MARKGPDPNAQPEAPEAPTLGSPAPDGGLPTEDVTQRVEPGRAEPAPPTAPEEPAAATPTVPEEPAAQAPSVSAAAHGEQAAATQPSPAPVVAPVAAAPSAAAPAPQAPAHAAPPRRPGRVRRAVAWLVRASLVILVVVVIGAGVYFGWPVVYDRYLAPVQTNTADVVILRDQVADLQRQVDDLVSSDAGVEARLAAIDGRLGELDAMDASLAAKDTEAAADVARQVQLLKGMELMSRARLFMFQANYGLAEQDIQAARDILAGIAEEASGTEAAAISVAVLRLDRVLGALPGFPVAARDDLDIAWLALLGRAPTESTAPGPSIAPEASSEPSPTPTP